LSRARAAIDGKPARQKRWFAAARTIDAPGWQNPGSRGSVDGMTERDVEKIKNREQFIATLRRVADALSRNEAFRIQVDKLRITVPADAELSLEHEVEGELEELELQLRWSRAKMSPDQAEEGEEE
jgi:amphi-Trp domain-containing protein